LAVPGLEGLSKRYVTETFVEDLDRCLHSGSATHANSWDTFLDLWGTRSCHRKMRKAGISPLVLGHGNSGTKGRYTNFETYLRHGDHLLAMSCLRSDCRGVMRSTNELLEFQRQSLHWALERETAPGDVQSFLRARLPFVAEPGDIYYNPVLERFHRGKPQLVLGGIIAEEMGLGKTVIHWPSSYRILHLLCLSPAVQSLY